MEPEDAELLSRWERKIIVGYRIFTGIYIGGALVTLLPAYVTYHSLFFLYIVYQLVRPAALLLLTNVVTEFVAKRLRSHRDLLFIGTALILCVIIIYFNPLLQAIQGVLLLPVLVSILFLDKKRVILAGALSIVAQLVLYWVNPDAVDTPFDLITYIFTLVGETLIAINIMNRGVEVWDQLRHKAKVEQELMIRNIVVEKDSKTDALTGLNNRKAFNEYLPFAVGVSAQTDTPLHMAVVDIDNFKQVNDQHGHLAGDAILRRIAQMIEHWLRPADFVARYGGEEFAVIIPEASLEEAVAIMEQIRTSIEHIRHVELEGRTITISVGISTLVAHEDAATFFARADDCLYAAKQSGKNRVMSPLRMTSDRQTPSVGC